jgi:hypothetical protein
MSLTPQRPIKISCVISTVVKLVFTVKVKEPHTIFEIPGAMIDKNGIVTNGWFTFTPPTNVIPALSADQITLYRMGPYLDHYIWITNRQNFLKFELLALAAR